MQLAIGSSESHKTAKLLLMAMKIVDVATRSGEKFGGRVTVVMLDGVVKVTQSDARQSQMLAEEEVFVAHAHIGREACGKHGGARDHEGHGDKSGMWSLGPFNSRLTFDALSVALAQGIVQRGGINKSTANGFVGRCLLQVAGQEIRRCGHGV